MAESSSANRKREKKPLKYKDPKKMKVLNHKIQSGMRGFLIFGAERENAAKREVYNLLNEYADILFGNEFDKKLQQDVTHGSADNDHEEERECCGIETSEGNEKGKNRNENEKEGKEEDDDEDIEKMVAKEIDSMKKVVKERRFQYITTGVNGIIFIKCSLSVENINELAQFILSDLEKTQLNKARNFSRLLPVTHICHADITAVRKIISEHMVKSLDENRTCETPKSFSVQFKGRFNGTLTRSQTVQEIAAIMIENGYVVNLTEPDVFIIVEVMKSVCCMNLVKDFFRFKKYNIHEITKTKENIEVEKTETQTTECG